jgi:hypothetical protein
MEISKEQQTLKPVSALEYQGTGNSAASCRISLGVYELHSRGSRNRP